jgi:hypothetical protein
MIFGVLTHVVTSAARPESLIRPLSLSWNRNGRDELFPEWVPVRTVHRRCRRPSSLSAARATHTWLMPPHKSADKETRGTLLLAGLPEIGL